MFLRFLFPILLTLFVSSCALNKIFLVPTPLTEKSAFFEYSEELKDTIGITFDTNKAPQFIRKSGQALDLSYSIENHLFPNRSGDTLNGWMMSPKSTSNGTTILFFHGNAGNLVYHLGLVTPLVKAGFNVFMFDYSGFGFSQGKARRKTVFRDGEDALNYLVSLPEMEKDQLVVYGQSLGGHLAGALTPHHQEKIDAVVIEGAFSSHRDIAADKVPILGRILVREIYNARKSIRSLQKPVLIIHSREDQTIPFEHGKRLLGAATEPKAFYPIDGPHIRGPLLYTDSIVHKIESLLKR